jgi:hypothetical protein
MKCTVCGKETFVRGEYRMDSGAAPALECACCGALNLDEAVALTEWDRSSVRMAAAARAAVVESEGSFKTAEEQRDEDPTDAEIPKKKA